jgi:translation initiation factor 1
MPRDENRTVYSTDPNFSKSCPRCGRYPCRCPKPKSLPPQQQTAAIRREVKGRGGKTVTVIRDLQLTGEDLAALAKVLKAACGSGGTVKDGTIEIQGDHREKIASKLQALGYKTKFIGG